ncbi:MAG: prephenate dehydrogenase [Eubacteriales bacterium]|nr:prephenate dehydrogenase [Eubacteriales bacterium]
MANVYGFIGLGLIGGSIAKGIRKAEPDCKIMAYMRTREKLELARRDNIVDVILSGVDESMSECDIIFLCTPVEYNEEYLKILKPILKEGAFITDVGSTKSQILKNVHELGMDRVFIGGHPMAGSERSGYEFSDPVLLENIFYMLCPSKGTPLAYTQRMVELVRALKANPYVIEADEHDQAVATISHLPHLVAAALVNLVHDTDSAEHTMKRLAAGGFKDITRVASSSPVMWQQIFNSNRDAVLAVLRKYIEAMEKIENDLKEDNMDAIHDLFVASGEYRASFADAHGLINAQYSFSVHVKDRPESISIISAILAAGSVSIKNIGINHNRETGDGALRIEFYDSDSCIKAEKLVSEYGFKVTR